MCDIALCYTVKEENWGSQTQLHLYSCDFNCQSGIITLMNLTQRTYD